MENTVSLCDALDRVLNKGVVVHGEIKISVAGVDLLYVGLRGLICASDIRDTASSESTSGSSNLNYHNTEGST